MLVARTRPPLLMVSVPLPFAPMVNWALVHVEFAPSTVTLPVLPATLPPVASCALTEPPLETLNDPFPPLFPTKRLAVLVQVDPLPSTTTVPIEPAASPTT